MSHLTKPMWEHQPVEEVRQSCAELGGVHVLGQETTAWWLILARGHERPPLIDERAVLLLRILAELERALRDLASRLDAELLVDECLEVPDRALEFGSVGGRIFDGLAGLPLLRPQPELEDVHALADARIDGNAITSDSAGIGIAGGASPTITGNTIDAGGSAIVVKHGSAPSISGNVICGEPDSIFVADGADPEISDNEACAAAEAEQQRVTASPRRNEGIERLGRERGAGGSGGR